MKRGRRVYPLIHSSQCAAGVSDRGARDRACQSPARWRDEDGRAFCVRHAALVAEGRHVLILKGSA